MINRTSNSRFAIAIILLGCIVAACTLTAPANAAGTIHDVIKDARAKMVKIYGAGGFRGLEPYQSGVLISAEGHILTVWSYVLDSDTVLVTLDDGRKYEAELLGTDPRLDIAILKIDGTELPHFKLSEAVNPAVGSRVLALSNLYGIATGQEPVSILHGCVSARTPLQTRRGAYKTPYQGDVFVVDAMTNNPGAAGGVVTDVRGRLAGLIGKELRNSLDNTWLNYAYPIDQLTAAVEDIRAGKLRPRTADDDLKRPEDPLNLALLGLVMVPDVVDRTPPFVDRVVPDSPAAKAGIKPDDLVLFVNGRVIQSLTTLREQLDFIDHYAEVSLTIQRDDELLEVKLRATQ